MKKSKPHLALLTLGALIGLSWLASCGGYSTPQSTSPTTGTVNTSITDPPSCSFAFSHVWVTVTKVTANISSTADDSSTGWVTLVDLTSNPMQVDLLSLASPACVLTQLGSTTGLPPGMYQQIRMYLLANNASAGPATNNCGTGNGFNCVVPSGGSPVELQLSSEAQTGIKIPSSQISSGGVTIAAGQATDLSIDFSACDSIVQEGNGQYRLTPVLHAGEVALNGNAISGTVLDSSSNAPVAGATVLLEQPDPNDSTTDRVVAAGMTASDGTFIFCPLTAGNYDVVVDAEVTNSSNLTVVYGPTIAFSVPLGTALTNIPLTPQGTPLAAPPPTDLSGQTTSAGSGGATVADVSLSALEDAVPSGGTTRHVTIPIFGAMSQPPIVETTPTPNPSTPVCPTGTDCFNYSLSIPPANPEVGTFASGSITFTPPASGTVNYSVNAQSSNCTASTPSPATAGPVTVLPNTSNAVSLVLAFTGCTAPM